MTIVKRQNDWGLKAYLEEITRTTVRSREVMYPIKNLLL